MSNVLSLLDDCFLALGDMFLKIKLEFYRYRAGLSIKGLSELSGVAEPTISRIENKKDYKPQAETLLKLAKALKISMQELIVEDEEDNKLQKAS
jgi:transcriptional regulator with XRE-family HTH domain